MFATRDDVLQWVRSVAYEIGLVAVIMKSDTNTGIRRKTSFVLIGRERSGQYRSRRKILSEEILAVGNVGVPLSFVGNQWLEVKDGW